MRVGALGGYPLCCTGAQGDDSQPSGAANSANGARLREQLFNESGTLSSVRTPDDVISNPSVLEGGVTPDRIEAAFKNAPGWRIETLGRGAHAGQGWVAREYTATGNATGRMLRWHPGDGHHGAGAYWRVNDGSGYVGGNVPNDPGVIR